MSNEINDSIKKDIEDKISSMTIEEKLKYMFDFALNNPTMYDEKDVDDITDWVRQGKPTEPDGPTGEFERIDQMLPPKKNQSFDDRAKDIEGVLNWMRTNNVSPEIRLSLTLKH